MNNLKKVTFIALILTLFFKISLVTKTIQAKEKTLNYEENSALALNYHRVRDDNLFDKFLTIFSNSKELSDYSVTSTQFEAHIKWLKEHDAHFLTEEELLKYKEQGKFPKRSVWINFDDMDNSIYRNAHPILEKYGVPATGFVITGEVGAEEFHNLKMATENELIQMKESGLWSFSSHTNDLHTMNEDGNSKLINTSNEELTTDLEKSNQYLKTRLGMDNQTLAYPYGQMRDSKVKGLEDANIEYGYALEERAITPEDNNYYLPRILISDDAFNQLVKNWEGFKNE